MLLVQFCPKSKHDFACAILNIFAGMKLLAYTAIACLLLVACTGHDANPTATAVIARGQMPALAKDAANNIHLVYGSHDSIMYTISGDGGNTYAAPVLVDTLQGLVAYATRGPQVATLKNGVAIIAVNKQGDIFSYTKNTSGKWLKTVRVNDADSTDKEGFLGLAGDGNNNLVAIWPDLRTDGHNKLYSATSADGGLHWSTNKLVYAPPGGSICECCKPSVVVRNNDAYVMFRNSLQGNRDLYLVHSGDNGQTFGQSEKLGKGNWPLQGCPMDGGGLALNNEGIVQTVWRREKKVFYARPGEAEKEIGLGKDCSIETMNGKNVIAWVDSTGSIICLLPGDKKIVVGKGSLPQLKAVKDDILCVWQDAGEIKSRLITAATVE